MPRYVVLLGHGGAQDFQVTQSMEIKCVDLDAAIVAAMDRLSRFGSGSAASCLRLREFCGPEVWSYPRKPE